MILTFSQDWDMLRGVVGIKQCHREEKEIEWLGFLSCFFFFKCVCQHLLELERRMMWSIKCQID